MLEHISAPFGLDRSTGGLCEKDDALGNGEEEEGKKEVLWYSVCDCQDQAELLGDIIARSIVQLS